VQASVCSALTGPRDAFKEQKLKEFREWLRACEDGDASAPSPETWEPYVTKKQAGLEGTHTPFGLIGNGQFGSSGVGRRRIVGSSPAATVKSLSETHPKP